MAQNTTGPGKQNFKKQLVKIWSIHEDFSILYSNQESLVQVKHM